MFFSLVVFVGDSTFKTPMPDNVVHGFGYIRYIKSKKEPLLSETEVAAALNAIQSGRLTPSFKTNRNHVKHVKAIVAKKHETPKVENPCPKCGAAMVKREAKKGANAGNSFWGCSTFPKCRGVKAV